MRNQHMRYSAGCTRLRLAAICILTALIGTTGRAAVTKGPDAGGYTATDATAYSFIDIAGASGAAAVLSGTDDAAVALTLPFALQFYGRAYRLICVSSNGALYFVTSDAACATTMDFANIDVTGVMPPGDRPALLPFWSDLTFETPGAGAVFYQTLGSPGARRFVVQWNNAYPQGSPNPVTFQVVLSEASDRALFQYKSVDLGPGNPSSKGAQATIGIRDAGALANGHQIAWSFDAPVVEDHSALLFAAAAADTTAPVTVASLSGPSGANGWYTGAVQVTLAATDPDSAVAETTYAVDGAAPVRYAAPFTVSGNAVHRLTFSSSDPSRNLEAPHTIEVKIDAAAPTIGASATPASLWPPNNKATNVTIQGTVADSVSGIDASSVRFTVSDAYGQVQPGGAVTIAANGAYAFAVPLIASRNGNDANGRTYTVVVTARDRAGNQSSARTVVTVPHDRGK